MIDEGGSLVLDASGSTDPDGNETIVGFVWDLDNDGQFDDATGVNPTLSPAQLAALGLPTNGPSSFPIALRVTDDGGLSAEDTTTVSIVNLPPVAVDDGVSVAAHQSINIDVLANDSDAEGDPLIVAQVTTPTNLGEVSINDDNTLRYRRHRRFGSDACDAFTYTISDGNGGFDTASVFVTVGSPTEDCGSGPGSSPPVADDQAVSTPQDTPVAITLTASDVDGDALTFAIVTGPTDGALSGTAPNVTYTPNAGFTGTDGFSFKANDGTVDSNIATVTIEVAAAPSPTGKVKGTVKKDGKRISGASVRLDPGTVSERQATTNKAGKFDFDSVPAGNHTITATDGVCGVGPFPILVTAGQTLTLDLFLVCP
ncbi:MAG: cadherin-like domain-containing protein [Proteobacteria bacterium]|nr:cadherin-like domain-containing protein [Pseudomonadota bacterium]